MIYLDNAATSLFKPQCVIDAVTDAITKYPFNPSRSTTKGAQHLQQKLLDTRQKIALLYNNQSDSRVIFTGGCTQALNNCILGTAKKGNIVISATEHNSVLRPIMQLKKRGIVSVSLLMPDCNGIITSENLDKTMKDDTYLVCVSHASNVTGTAQNIEALGKVVRRRNALMLVDDAQGVGHLPIDMTKCCVDMVAFGSHKGLHGIQGAGAFVFNERVNIKPICYGGTGTESQSYYQPETLPDSLESGTLPCPAILGMSAGIDYWLQNWKQNALNIASMQKIIIDGLKQIESIKIYSQPNKCGIIAFNIGESDSTLVADLLAEKDIAVRGGLHCAPLMHKYLGTFETGVVRASVGIDTTTTDCENFVSAVSDIAQKLK